MEGRVSELSPEERGLLERARQARRPTAEAKARVYGRVMGAAALAGTAAAGAAAQTAKTSVLHAIWFKWLAGAVLAVALGSGAFYARSSSKAPPGHASASAAPRSAAQPPSLPAPAPAPSAAAVPDELLREPPAPRTLPSRPLPSAGDLSAEVALLHEAHEAWRSGNAARTLELVTQHTSRYPRSQLASARTTLRILALCKLGRTAEARRAAQQVLQSDPKSPARASLKGSCVDG